MRARAFLLRSLVVGLMAAPALLGQASPAVAGEHVRVRPATFSFEAQLPSSDGYSVYLRGYGHRRIELDLGTEDFEEPYVTMNYTTEGKVTRRGVEADFGRFGHIDLSFVGPLKRSVSHSPNCQPHGPTVNAYGRMTGSAEFETLGGVVKLESDQLSVEGQTRSSPRQTCAPKPSHVYGRAAPAARRPHRVESGEGSVTTVLARAHSMGRTIDVYASKLNHEIVPDMAATSMRRFGKVSASTSVHAPEGEAFPGEAVQFAVKGSGVRPRGVTLSAAEPFTGSARYRKQPGDPPSWLGSLSVEMPGEGTLLLAGPEFHAIACTYASNRLQRACERTVAPPHTA